MPRRARIDAVGALHHVIIRGIERRKIFRSDYDRQNFLDRLETLEIAKRLNMSQSAVSRLFMKGQKFSKENGLHLDPKNPHVLSDTTKHETLAKFEKRS